MIARRRRLGLLALTLVACGDDGGGGVADGQVTSEVLVPADGTG